MLEVSNATLPATSAALAYKGLLRVEHAFRTLKHGVDIRPVYHRLDHRSRAHVTLCMLAYLLERIVEIETKTPFDHVRDGPLDVRATTPAELIERALVGLPTNRVRVDLARAPEVLRVDAERAALALRTLVDNAVQATPAEGGTVEVRFERHRQDVVIEVRDHGSGLAKGEDGQHFEPFDVVLTDLRMPGVDGMADVRSVRTEQPDIEVIVLTAFGDVATAVEAMKLGAFDYLEKPVSSPTAMRELVAAAIERRGKLASPVRAQLPASTKLTFGAPTMIPVVDALGRVAKTQATVLIQGESGTGKEVAARYLHDASPRAKKPFVAINCAVLNDGLLESQLGFPIRLPPLRERREDILPLAESLLAQLSVLAGRVAPPRLDDAAKARLRREVWPGNVRELRNVLERAMILADGPLISPQHLWIEADVAEAKTSPADGTGDGSLVALERLTIERTLAAVGGNRRLAAAKLGIGLRTLYEKLRRYQQR